MFCVRVPCRAGGWCEGGRHLGGVRGAGRPRGRRRYPHGRTEPHRARVPPFRQMRRLPVAACRRAGAGRFRARSCRGGAGGRSEEHTSELQSLMRISYAAFCLKTKKNDIIAHVKRSLTNNQRSFEDETADTLEHKSFRTLLI